LTASETYPVLCSTSARTCKDNCLSTGMLKVAQLPASFYQVHQQDATLYNILYYCQCSTCFRRFLRPSSVAQNCTHSIWYVSSLLAATASVGELDTYQLLCVQFWAPDDGRRNRLKHVEHWQ